MDRLHMSSYMELFTWHLKIDRVTDPLIKAELRHGVHLPGLFPDADNE